MIVLGLLLLLFAPLAAATPGFMCYPPAPVPGASAISLTTCWSDPHTPMVRDDADHPYPSGYVMEWFPTQPLTIKMKFDGWGDNTITADFSERGAIMIKSVYSHYPLSAWPLTQCCQIDMDMGGPLHGKNANGYRLVATLNEIAAKGYNIDYGAGIHIGGNCLGGMAAVTQSLILPDPFWQSRITVVNGLLPGMTADPPYGKYWTGQAYWNPIDITTLQHSKNLDKIKNVHYHFNASSYPADDIFFNQNFFKEVCDKGISCWAVWGRQGHAWPDPEAPQVINDTLNRSFQGADMDSRLDKVYVAFSNATSNWFGPRGHYNLGLEFKRSLTTDTADSISIPVRYLRYTGLGVGIGDQPNQTTFDLWLRHPQEFPMVKGTLLQYTVEGKTRYAGVTKNGEVKLQKITLGSNTNFTDVVVQPAGC